MLKTNRREFIRTGSAALFAASAGRIFGADAPSDRVRLAVMGCHEWGRGICVARAAAKLPGVEIAAVCDVDSRARAFAIKEIERLTGRRPYEQKDIRKVLEDKTIDGILCEVPDHWHAPAAWMAMNAGKHVYVEKPCAFCPSECELLVRTQKKTGMVLQVGSQRRSSDSVAAAIAAIPQLIGEPRHARCWYSSFRAPIGKGKEVAVPDWLDWDLWQGPAPRRAFHDNYVHYKWHWFRHWGTGEMGNNSPHFIDVARWALGEKYPVRTLSSGMRVWHRGEDDWEWPDTQTTSYEFASGKFISWDCRSCYGYRSAENVGTGCQVFGSEGTMVFDQRDKVFVYDKKNELVKTFDNKLKADWQSSTTGAGPMDFTHVNNFVEAIRLRKPEHCTAPVWEGAVSSELSLLANVSWLSGGEVLTDPETGALKSRGKPEQFWSREYEKGWEMS